MARFIYHGKTALVTGASSGIGEAFARELAARGMNLLLVARSADRLRQIANELSSTRGVSATPLPFDLASSGAVPELIRSIDNQPIDLLINNAGFGTSGPFSESDPVRDREEILVNILAPVELARALLPGMIVRGEGAIINLSSNAAFQPIPYMAVYAATKAFVLSFSQALHAEVEKHGIRVVALCPGPTETRFFDVANAEQLRDLAGDMRSPEQVVATGLRALERNRAYVIDGNRNSTIAHLAKLAPPTLVAKGLAHVLEPD